MPPLPLIFKKYKNKKNIRIYNEFFHFRWHKWQKLLWVSAYLHKESVIPLPYIKKRCPVTARSTGEQCKNPAAFGCRTCRYHGARRKETIRSGKDHPQFKNGRETRDIRRKRSHGLARLREIEWELFEKGLMSGKRTPGPKPKPLR